MATQRTFLLTFCVSCRRSSWPSMVRSRARTQKPRGPAVGVASREADRAIVLQRCEGLHASDLGPGKLVWKYSIVTGLVDLTGAANWRHSCNCKLQSSSACCVVTNSQRTVKQNLIAVPYSRSCTDLSIDQLLSGDHKARTRWIKHRVIVESSLDFVKFVLGPLLPTPRAGGRRGIDLGISNLNCSTA